MGKVYLATLIVLVGLISCKNQKSAQTPEAVIPVADVLERAPEFTNQLVQVEGMVVHVCRESGKRLFMGEERFKVLASDKIGKFDVTLEGSDIAAIGYIREDKIDETYLDTWEDELSSGAEVQLKEEIHTGEAEARGEDESAITTQLNQIKGYREEIAASEKGYISFYSLEVVSIKEL
jgi:hypothetical protein